MLIPVINYDNPPPEALMSALAHFEARCQMSGRVTVSEDEVRAFLREEYPGVAELFRATHLRPA